MNKLAKIAFAGLAGLLAASGPVHAASRLDGTAALARGNYVDAANKARPLAERGDAPAQALLGFMYEHGRGVAQDYGAAVYWYTCAAEQGHPTAQYLLGLMYDKGHGVVRSDVLAYKWLNLAAARARPGVREYYLRIRDAVAAKLSASQSAEAQWLASSFVPRR
jgi:TPR repeat protein